MARAGVLARVRRQRRVEFRGGVEQQLRRGLCARWQRERGGEGQGKGEKAMCRHVRANAPERRYLRLSPAAVRKRT